jgi:hypothetical protein
MIMARVHLPVPDRLDYFLGSFGGCEDLPVAALEALIFLRGDHDRPVAAVAGHDDGLSQGQILKAPDLPAELSRGDANHIFICSSPIIAEARVNFAHKSFKAESLVIGHELVESRSALGEVIGLVGKHMLQRQPPLIADHPRRQHALVNHADEEGP